VKYLTLTSKKNMDKPESHSIRSKKKEDGMEESMEEGKGWIILK
jgi:hypothetical protein